VIPLQNKIISERKILRYLIPVLGAMILFLPSVQATEASRQWSDKQAILTIEEYFDLLFATRFQNLNPAEPTSVDFVPNKSTQAALIFVVRPVVTPDVDLTDQSEAKAEIVSGFRANVIRQGSTHVALTGKLLKESSIKARWPGASVEQNFAIRFVKADNVRQTVAITSKGKTTFDQGEISAASALIKPRAGELWVE
jgi:hypothetical protein